MNRHNGYISRCVLRSIGQAGPSATHRKDATVWEAVVEELLRYIGHLEAIQYAVVDMSGSYAKGVSANFGNAQLVYDMFNVIKYVVDDYEQIWKIASRADGVKRDQL